MRNILFIVYPLWFPSRQFKALPGQMEPCAGSRLSAGFGFGLDVLDDAEADQFGV